MRDKIFVASILVNGREVIAGIAVGRTDDEARRLFAAERKRSPNRVVVRWTGRKDVTFKQFSLASRKQEAYLS